MIGLGSRLRIPICARDWVEWAMRDVRCASACSVSYGQIAAPTLCCMERKYFAKYFHFKDILHAGRGLVVKGGRREAQHDFIRRPCVLPCSQTGTQSHQPLVMRGLCLCVLHQRQEKQANRLAAQCTTPKTAKARPVVWQGLVAWWPGTGRVSYSTMLQGRVQGCKVECKVAR